MAFLFALSFLTRFPVPFEIKYNNEITAKSMSYYSLVGIIIGFFLVLFDLMFSKLFPVIIVNGLLIMFLVYISGALHLDGFMDTVDGIYSSRDRERMLEIMHDSRVGSFGVTGLFLLFLLKFTALYTLTGDIRIYVLLIMPALSRWFMVLIAYTFTVTKTSKLGKSFKDRLKIKQVFISSFWIFILISILTFYHMSLVTVILSFLLTLLIIAGLAKNINNKLGGLNGDVYGAICEISEVLFLLSFILFQGMI